MSLEERMLERFTRERQRDAKNAVFNVEDETELTHYGHRLSNLDDFDDVGLGFDDEDEDEGKGSSSSPLIFSTPIAQYVSQGQIDGEVVKKTHFGGFSDDEEVLPLSFPSPLLRFTLTAARTN